MANSYNPAYGARPLRRWLEQVVITELSRRLVAGELTEGCTVTVNAQNGALTYAIERTAGPEQILKRTRYGSSDMDGVSILELDSDDDLDEA